MKSRSRSGAPAVRALTLIELLVVIAILMLLSALILPVLSRGRATARSVVCLGNLKQWGVATHLFALDHDDFLPTDGAPNGSSRNRGWYVDLPKVLEIAPYHSLAWRTNAAIEPETSLWICPSNSRRSNGNNLFHYCLNQHINRAGTGNQVRLTSVARPAKAVWLFDNGKLAAVAQQNNVHTNIHQEGAQFVFLDGHATRFRAVDYWDWQQDRGRTNHPDLVWVP